MSFCADSSQITLQHIFVKVHPPLGLTWLNHGGHSPMFSQRNPRVKKKQFRKSHFRGLWTMGLTCLDAQWPILRTIYRSRFDCLTLDVFRIFLGPPFEPVFEGILLTFVLCKKCWNPFFRNPCVIPYRMNRFSRFSMSSRAYSKQITFFAFSVGG